MVEAKRRLSAKQLLADIRAGMTDQELARKYELTTGQLHSVFRKLTNAGLLDDARPAARTAPVKREQVTGRLPPLPQTNEAQAESSARKAVFGPAAAEPMVLTAAAGLKGEWKGLLSQDFLRLESLDGKHSVEIPVSHADEKLRLMESSIFPPVLVLLEPKRTAFKLDPDQLRRFKEWLGPPTPARLRHVLKPRFSFCIAIGILYLVTSLPLSGVPESGIEPVPFNPIGTFLGVSLLGLALLAKFRPSRTLLLLDAIWFLVLAANVGIGIYRGDSLWWLIMGPVLIWSAFEAYRDFKRLEPPPNQS
jgi:hypothetical protein